MDIVEEYYKTGRLRAGCAISCFSGPLPPPDTPPPPMTPPPNKDLIFIYQLKNTIDKNSAYFLWSFFSESHGIFLPEKGPYTSIHCTKLLDIADVHKKMVEYSKLYDLYCFDSIYILPTCVMQAHIE
jgi:hypothetical protein